MLLVIVTFKTNYVNNTWSNHHMGIPMGEIMFHLKYKIILWHLIQKESGYNCEDKRSNKDAEDRHSSEHRKRHISLVSL